MIERTSAATLRKEAAPYTTVSNVAIELIRNVDALAIWIYLQSKPESWIVRAADIQKHFDIGRDKYRKAMAYLMDAGFISYRRLQGDGGKMLGTEIHVHYKPSNRQPENPHRPPEKPSVGKSGPLVTEELLETVPSVSSLCSETTGTGGNCEFPQPPPPGKEQIPYEEIVALYHELLPMCPQVRKLTEARRKQIRARWRDGDLPDLDTWRAYFRYVAKSKFLTGLSPPGPGRSKPFVANLKWLTNEENYAKVFEQFYHR